MAKKAENVLVKQVLEDCFKRRDWKLLNVWENGTKALVDVCGVKLELEIIPSLKEKNKGFFKVDQRVLLSRFRQVLINEALNVLIVFDPFVVFEAKILKEP